MTIIHHEDGVLSSPKYVVMHSAEHPGQGSSTMFDAGRFSERGQAVGFAIARSRAGFYVVVYAASGARVLAEGGPGLQVIGMAYGGKWEDEANA